METPPLLLISSDMNHFATDEENRRLDAIALEAMERLDPEHLLKTVNEHNISMCGVLPAVIVMEALRMLGGLTSCERVALRHQRRRTTATPAASSATPACCSIERRSETVCPVRN